MAPKRTRSPRKGKPVKRRTPTAAAESAAISTASSEGEAGEPVTVHTMREPVTVHTIADEPADAPVDSPITDDEDIPQGQVKAKRRRREIVSLTGEAEMRVIDFLQQNRCLYDKASELYKSKEHREALWQKIADEVGKEKKDIVQWYNTQRTVFSKMHNNKTGSGAFQLTERKKFVLDNFKFLQGHIFKKGSYVSQFASQPGVPVARAPPSATLPMPPASSPPSQSDASEVVATPTDEVSPEFSTPVLPPSLGDRGRDKRRSSNVSDLSGSLAASSSAMKNMEDILSKLVDKIHSSASASSSPVPPPPRKEKSAREIWVEWQAAEMMALPDSLWTEFQMQQNNLIMEFRSRAEALAATRPVMQPPVQPPIQQPPVQPPIQQPAVQPPIQQPAVQPPIQQPAVQPPIQQPAVQPPIQQPAVQPPIQQPPVQPQQPPPPEPQRVLSTQPSQSASTSSAAPLDSSDQQSATPTRPGTSHQMMQFLQSTPGSVSSMTNFEYGQGSVPSMGSIDSNFMALISQAHQTLEDEDQESTESQQQQ